MLKRVEQRGDGDMSTVCCPECDAPVDFEDTPPDHYEGCALARAIAHYEILTAEGPPSPAAQKTILLWDGFGTPGRCFPDSARKACQYCGRPLSPQTNPNFPCPKYPAVEDRPIFPFNPAHPKDLP